METQRHCCTIHLLLLDHCTQAIDRRVSSYTEIPSSLDCCFVIGNHRYINQVGQERQTPTSMCLASTPWRSSSAYRHAEPLVRPRLRTHSCQLDGFTADQRLQKSGGQIKARAHLSHRAYRANRRSWAEGPPPQWSGRYGVRSRLSAVLGL